MFFSSQFSKISQKSSYVKASGTVSNHPIKVKVSCKNVLFFVWHCTVRNVSDISYKNRKITHKLRIFGQFCPFFGLTNEPRKKPRLMRYTYELNYFCQIECGIYHIIWSIYDKTWNKTWKKWIKCLYESLYFTKK